MVTVVVHFYTNDDKFRKLVCLRREGVTPWFSGISGRQRHEYESNLRGNEHYLSRSENKAWKKHLFFLFFICSSNIWLSYIHSRLLITSRVYLEPHDNKLLVGFLAQLVERCTGTAEVMDSNPVQAWIFFRPYFHYCSSSVHYCEDRFHIHMGDCCKELHLSPSAELCHSIVW